MSLILLKDGANTHHACIMDTTPSFYLQLFCSSKQNNGKIKTGSKFKTVCCYIAYLSKEKEEWK